MTRLPLCLPLAAATLVLGACTPDSTLSITNSLPTAQIVSHAEGEQLVEGYAVTFRGTGYDPDDGPDELTATWWMAGEELCPGAVLSEQGMSECTAVVPLAAELATSSVAVDLELTDSFGAVDVTSVDLRLVSSEAPQVLILEPADGGLAYADQELVLEGTASDDLDNASLLVATWESDLDGLLETLAVAVDGSILTTAYLSPGTHTLSLHVEDTVSQVGSDSVSLEVFETNTAPTCAITAPADGAAGSPEDAVAFTALLDDAEEGPLGLSATWWSDLDGSLGSGSPDSTGLLSATLAGLSEGTHTLRLDVSDSAGLGCTDSVQYTAGAAPTVVIVAPSDGEVVSEGELVRFEASVADDLDDPMDLTVVWESNWDGVLDTFGADSSGTATFSTSLLSIGEHTVSLTVTDTDGFSTTELVDVIVNDLPGAPVISLSPDPASTSDDLVVSIDTPSSDAEGDTITYTYAWTVDGVASSASSSATFPAASTARDQLVAVTVTPNDGVGDGDSATASLTVHNSAPALSSVVLDPDPAYVADTLSCTPSGASDADGDSISYTYAWTVDGSTVSATGSTLTSSYWAKGEDVQCTVTPDDGTDAGSAVASNTVTIENTAPSISAVAISPASPEVTDDLSCTYTGFSDDDGDSDQSSIAWTVNGSAAGSSSTLASGSFSAGDTVTCTVTPDDGEDTGTALSDSVTVDNTAPSISSVSVSPSSPEVGDTLSCTYSGYSDDDGDADQSTYAWTVNGGSTVGTSSTLTSTTGGFARGDTVTCTVTPYDGTDTGTALSDSVSVDNTAPVLADASLSPDPATEGDTLTCTPGSATDDDGDSISYSYAWTVDGSNTGTSGSTLSDGYWAKGQDVICTVTPTDGTDAGSAVDSNTVTIGNAAPSISSVSISPTSPAVTDDLTCSYAGYSDPDGDADQSTYAWTVNGSSAGTSSTLSAGSFAAGDTVACTVTPDDGTDTGTAASASVTVGNSAPSISAVSISPSTAQAGDTLTCTYSGYADADGDPDQSTYAWTVNGSSAGTSSTLSSGFSGGDTVTCTVTPYDGYTTGTALSDSITIDNTAPVLADASLSPDPAYEGDTLSCTPGSASDADGDAVSYTYSWTVDGSSTGTSGSTLDDGYWAKGQDVICTVTPTDGTDTGSAVDSNTVTIENTAPSITDVAISPADPTVSDSLSCSWSGFDDADGDSDQSTVSWTISGTVVGTSTTLSSGYASGDTVTCTVTPYDGEDTGTAASTSVIVDNSPPELADATLSPDPATEGDTLSCTPGSASDADGDSISYTYAWRVDGALVSASTSTLSDAWWDKGEDVTCTVTPDDGTDSGDSVDSNTVTISNALPELASVSISPASPTVTDTLTCSYAGFSDADGDSDNSTYSWTISGTEVGTSSTLSSGYSAGDTVTCTVTPNDGTDDGTALSDAVTVENSPPEVTSVSISPADPTVSDDLECSASATDDDGDTVTLSYSWTISGTEVGTSATLSAGSHVSGDTVTCTVTPSDGTEDGSTGSDSVTIENAVPVMSTVSLTPTSAYEGDTLSCSASATDADGDTVTFSYEWYVDGAQIAATGSTLSDAWWAKGEDVFCSVTPSDGSDAGSSMDSNTVTIDNSPPELASVSISPASPAVTDTLTCSYSGFSDADGDSDNSTYSWTISGTEVGTSATLSSGYAAGDTVTCTVTPNDGEEDGTALSDAVTVENTAPEITSVSISPTSPTVSDTLSCSASATDDDGDTVTLSYEWTVSGTTVGTSSTLSSGFSAGDTVTCTVTPDDGTDTGTPDSDSVTVDNTAPELASVSLSPATAYEADTLTCTPTASDADGDSISYTYAWTVSGSTVAASGSTLTGSSFDKHDDVFCTVTPDDGTDTGSPMSSSTVTISNTLPELASVSISPAAPTVRDTLSCSAAGFSDDDGDSDNSTYSWTISGTEVGTSATLSSGYASGDTVTCTVTPNDGEGDGTALSDSVTVQNSAPSISSVSISPSAPGPSDSLSCSYSGFSDADGDADQSTYSWTISGTEVGTSSTLSSSATSVGDTVTCTVTPDDGTDTGTALSDSVTVTNSAPVMTSVSLTPTTAREGDTLTCTPAATDADGDSISYSYAWTVDGSSTGTTASTLGDSYWDRGEDVICTVTPSDGTDTGSAMSSNTVTIANTAPSTSSVSISPSSAQVGDTLTCSATGSDADGDTVSFTYAWTVGGSSIGSGSTVSSGFSSGDTVTCTATPSDGTDTGTTGSDSITISNTAPVLGSVAITPASPTVEDTLTCSASATDADGDTVSFTYAWTVGGSSVGSSSTLSTGFSRGDTVTCTVTPTDGTDTGSSGSDSVSVGNAAPEVLSASLSPSSPDVGDTLTVSASTYDADADSVSLSYAWFVNSTQVATTSSLSVGTYAVKGDSIHLELTPSDGTDTGSTATTSTVTVANSAPSAPTVDATDDPEEGVDDIWCEITTASTDADGDSLTYDIEWEADGLVYPDDYASATGPDTTDHTGDTVPAADTSLATDWTCYVATTDGTDWSAEASDTATVVSSGITGSDWGQGASASGTSISHLANYVVVQEVSLSSAITLTGFGIDIQSGSANIMFVLYDESGGLPDALVAESASAAIAAGTNQVAVDGGTVSLAAGTYYLGKVLDNSVSVVHDSATTDTYYYYAHSYGGAFPTAFGSTSYSSFSGQTIIAQWLIGY